MSSIILLVVTVIALLSLELVTAGPILERPEDHQLVQAGQQDSRQPEADFRLQQETEVDEFMQTMKVTPDEVEEYQRITGFNPPEGLVEEGRSLNLLNPFNLWPFNMFRSFKDWIFHKRGVKPTTSPHVVVLNQFPNNQHRPVY